MPLISLLMPVPQMHNKTDVIKEFCVDSNSMQNQNTYFSIGNDSTFSRLEIQHTLTEDSVRVELVHGE